MRISRDVISYGQALRAIRELQDGIKRNRKVNPLPEMDSENRSEIELFKSGKIEYREIKSEDVKIWLSVEANNAEIKDPILHSGLPTLLEQETWAPVDGLLILSGVDPRGALVEWRTKNHMGAEIDAPKIRNANWFSFSYGIYDHPLLGSFGLDEADELAHFKDKILRLRSSMLDILKRRWESCDQDQELRRSPGFYVRWAESRGFEIEWIEWARENKYLNAAPPEPTAAPFFDADAEEYPRLLHIAVRAWEHAIGASGGTAKQRITAFLNDRYPELSVSERDAIALIGNWQKTGGRPKIGG